MNSRPLTAMLLVAASLGPICIRAQNAAAIEQVMVSISLQAKELDVALENLGVICKTLRGTDADASRRSPMPDVNLRALSMRRYPSVLSSGT